MRGSGYREESAKRSNRRGMTQIEESKRIPDSDDAGQFSQYRQEALFLVRKLAVRCGKDVRTTSATIRRTQPIDAHGRSWFAGNSGNKPEIDVVPLLQK
jgi:hypothetical protein